MMMMMMMMVVVMMMMMMMMIMDHIYIYILKVHRHGISKIRNPSVRVSIIRLIKGED